jgi:hypothetical protein
MYPCPYQVETEKKSLFYEAPKLMNKKMGRHVGRTVDKRNAH